MRRCSFALSLLFLVGMSAAAQQTIYWKKDHIYSGPGGKEIAMVVPGAADQTAPAAPVLSTSPTVTGTSVTLSWSAVTDNPGGSGLSSYRIFRQMGSGSTLPVGTVGPSTLTFSDQGLTPSTGYSYSIRAFDNAQNHSGPSNTVSVTTSAFNDTTPPDAPSNLQGTATGRQPSYSVHLTWNAAIDTGGSGLAGYRVYRNDVLVSGSNLVTALYFDDAPGVANTSFTYKVKAVDGAGNVSAFSSPVSVTTLRELVWYVESNTLWPENLFLEPYWYFSVPWWEPGSFRASADFINIPSATTAGLYFWGQGSPCQYQAVVQTEGTLHGRLLYVCYTEWYLPGYQQPFYFVDGYQVADWWDPATVVSGTLTVEADSNSHNIKVYWNGTLRIDYTATTGPYSGAVGTVFHSPTSDSYTYYHFLIER